MLMFKRVKAAVERWRGDRRDGARLDWLERQNIVIKTTWVSEFSYMHSADGDVRRLIDLAKNRQDR